METTLANHCAKAITGHPASPIDPHTFGLNKAAYSVNETIDLLSIGRTSLYVAVSQGNLHPVKFGRKTLFYAADLAAFLAKLRDAGGQGASAEKRDDGR